MSDGLQPALGTRGEPASWRREAEDAPVELARPGWGDARWSYLFGPDTQYAAREAPDPGVVAEANRRMRTQTATGPVRGPVIHAPVWTWEVPAYFWLGGIASGASFAALAADLAGDGDCARIARRVALGAVAPAPLLLVADLGRPARFLNMLRIFKPRSPMNTGAWCLTAFSAAGAGAVGADLVGGRRTGKALGAGQAVLGTYLGSYTGVLLAATAVPAWSRSRAFLGPIFVSTATATGAAATRLALAAGGREEGDPALAALDRVQAAAIVAELALSAVNERRARPALAGGGPMRAAKALVLGGLVLPRLARGSASRRARGAASMLVLAGGLAFRLAWVDAGKASARDDDGVALAARERRRAVSVSTSPARRPGSSPRFPRAWSGAVGRASLAAERFIAARSGAVRRPRSGR